MGQFIVYLAQDEHIRATLLHKSEPSFNFTGVVHQHFELKYLQLSCSFCRFRIYRDNQAPKRTIHNDGKAAGSNIITLIGYFPGPPALLVMEGHFCLKVLDEVDILLAALEVTEDGFSPGGGDDDPSAPDAEVLDLLLKHFLGLNGELLEHVKMDVFEVNNEVLGAMTKDK